MCGSTAEPAFRAKPADTPAKNDRFSEPGTLPIEGFRASIKAEQYQRLIFQNAT